MCNKLFGTGLFMSVLIIALFSSGSYAETNCGVDQSIIQTVSFGTINVQRDVAVGTTIATVNVPGSASIFAFSSSGRQYCEGHLSMLYLGGVRSSINNVYNTNLAGVGIAMTGVPGDWSLTSAAANVRTNTYPSNYTVSLIKTGPITAGTLTPGSVAQGYFGPVGQNFIQVSLDSASKINVLACSINTPSLSFPMGDISAADFGSSISFVPAKTITQNLGLNCDAGANINVMLQGTQNPDVSTTSVLALTGQGNTDVAQGVGVQLLYNGTQLALNNRIMLKQSSGSQETFPITAQYYQTKTSVSTGQANASATLDLTYQ